MGFRAMENILLSRLRPPKCQPKICFNIYHIFKYQTTIDKFKKKTEFRHLRKFKKTTEFGHNFATLCAHTLLKAHTDPVYDADHESEVIWAGTRRNRDHLVVAVAKFSFFELSRWRNSFIYFF